MTPTGRDNNIDSVLRLFDKQIQVTEEEIKAVVGNTETFNTIEQMSLIGLIKGLGNVISSGGTCFILTSFGVEVHRHGSWTKYLADKEEDKKLADRQIKSSIRTNNTTILILVITVIISGLGAWVSWLNYDFVKKHQEPSRTSIDSLLNKLIERQTETLQDLRQILKSDSLKKSLKVYKKVKKK